jgi:hypothetical protein
MTMDIWRLILAELPQKEQMALASMSDAELQAKLNRPEASQKHLFAAWHLFGGYDRYRERRAMVHRAKIAALVEAGEPPEMIAEAVANLSALHNSEERLAKMLTTLSSVSAPAFWPSFGMVWSVCDDTWSHRKKLLNLLHRHWSRSPARGVGDQSKSIRVYRGCSRRRVRGVSWTTDAHVAAMFARGHRGIRVPNAVVASASVPRIAVFHYEDSREESEVLLDPDRLLRLRVERFGP